MSNLISFLVQKRKENVSNHFEENWKWNLFSSQSNDVPVPTAQHKLIVDSRNSFRKSCRTYKSPCKNTNVFLKSNIILLRHNKTTRHHNLHALNYFVCFYISKWVGSLRLEHGRLFLWICSFRFWMNHARSWPFTHFTF